MIVEHIQKYLNGYKNDDSSSSSSLNYSVLYKEEVESTNLWGKDLARGGAPEGTVLLADRQTAGKGRRGRNWSSEGGHSIYMSLVLRPDIPPENASMLTLVIGLSVTQVCRQLEDFKASFGTEFKRCNADDTEKFDGSDSVFSHLEVRNTNNTIEPEKNDYCTVHDNCTVFVSCNIGGNQVLNMNGDTRRNHKLDARIKWPNDVVISGKKICGILTEMSMKAAEIDYVIAGIGINVNTKEFPEEIRQTATSLALEAGKPLSREWIIAAVLHQISINYKKFLETGDLTNLMEEYNEVLVNREHEIRVLDPKGEYRGTAAGINEKGELLVTKEDGTCVEVYAGEVSVRGIYGYV